ncbi:MAG: zinc-dependent alcohol dehydrogenase family protein [Candidatus Deferrimicrobiaceae bacterium]
MKTMKAFITRSCGPEARFEAADIPVPVPVSGQILIEVKATSLNPVDNVFLRQDIGMNPELPAVLHGDVAGVVSAVGQGVEGFKRGDEVYACAGGFRGHGGALAEFMAADARLVAHKPRTLDFASAAALPLVAITAWEGLIDRANLRSGQHVLIHGGTGGVGHVALQLAKSKGARVATTVSSEDKAKIVRDLGADEIIFYREQTVEQYVENLTDGQGFDIVYDTVGGQNLDHSFAATRSKGQVINILAFRSHDLAPAFARGLIIHFENMSIPLLTGVGRERQGDILREVAKLVDEGNLKPLIHGQRFTFDEANEAHGLFEAKRYTGKIVLTS